MKFARLLSLALLTALVFAPLTSSAAQFRFDFNLEITSLDGAGDPAETGNLTSNIEVGSNVQGFLTVETEQQNRTDLATNGEFSFGGLSLDLNGKSFFALTPLAGFVFIEGRPFLQQFDRGMSSDFVLGAQAILTPEPLEVGDIVFNEDFILSNETPSFADPTVLDPVEIAANLLSAEFNGTISRREGFVNAKNIITTRTLDFESFNGVITEVSVSAVPLPATGLLLLGGFGALVAFRRKHR